MQPAPPQGHLRRSTARRGARRPLVLRQHQRGVRQGPRPSGQAAPARLPLGKAARPGLQELTELRNIAECGRDVLERRRHRRHRRHRARPLLLNAAHRRVLSPLRARPSPLGRALRRFKALRRPTCFELVTSDVSILAQLLQSSWVLC